jgi:hypothetical protein
MSAAIVTGDARNTAAKDLDKAIVAVLVSLMLVLMDRWSAA